MGQAVHNEDCFFQKDLQMFLQSCPRKPSIRDYSVFFVIFRQAAMHNYRIQDGSITSAAASVTLSVNPEIPRKVKLTKRLILLK